MQLEELVGEKMVDKSLTGNVELVDKAPENLEIGEGTFPAGGGKFRGVSVGRNDYGYFAFTHRTNSREFNTPADIPDETVTFVRSTG